MLSSPNLRVADASEEERSELRHLQSRLRELEQQLFNYACALALCEACASQIERIRTAYQEARKTGEVFVNPTTVLHYESQLAPHAGFQRIAVRDSVMTIWHYANILESLQGLRQKCPKFEMHLDTKGLNREIDVFKKSRFPHWEKMRKAVAHIGELRENRQAATLNSITGDYSGFGLQMQGAGTTGFVYAAGSQLAVTWEREVVRADLTKENLHKLEKTTASIFALFKEAAAKQTSNKAG